MPATGRWAFLNHLKGAADPETLFQAVPGIGPELARRVCETLHVDTLEGRPSTMDGWSRFRDLGIAAPRWSGLPSQPCSPGSPKSAREH